MFCRVFPIVCKYAEEHGGETAAWRRDLEDHWKRRGGRDPRRHVSVYDNRIPAAAIGPTLVTLSQIVAIVTQGMNAWHVAESPATYPGTIDPFVMWFMRFFKDITNATIVRPRLTRAEIAESAKFIMRAMTAFLGRGLTVPKEVWVEMARGVAAGHHAASALDSLGAASALVDIKRSSKKKQTRRSPSTSGDDTSITATSSTTTRYGRRTQRTKRLDL